MTDVTPTPVVAPVTPVIAPATVDNGTPSPIGIVIAPSAGSDAPTTPAFDTTAWLAALDQESRELATKKNWKSPADLTKSYVNLEQEFSKRAPTSEPVKHTADAYKFTLPDNAKDIGYSEDFANGFRAFSAENNLSPEVAAKVHDFYTKYATDSLGKQTTDYATEVATRITATEGELVKAWGATNNPVFKRNAELATRAMTQLGVMDAMAEAGVLVKHDKGTTVANAQLFQMFAKIGTAMYAEDTIHGPAVTNGKNPFDPASADQASQGALIKSDPEKALLLISALSPTDQEMWKAVLPSIRARVAKK